MTEAECKCSRSQFCKACLRKQVSLARGERDAALAECDRLTGDWIQAKDEANVLRSALEAMIFAGRDAYDNGYPEMERAVVEARAALAGVKP